MVAEADFSKLLKFILKKTMVAETDFSKLLKFILNQQR